VTRVTRMAQLCYTHGTKALGCNCRESVGSVIRAFHACRPILSRQTFGSALGDPHVDAERNSSRRMFGLINSIGQLGEFAENYAIGRTS
jgi:hypothetical protein